MTTKVELGAAAMIAASKTLDKWSNRDDLEDGGSYVVDASLVGTVNGVGFDLPIKTTLTVGHESTKASSATPAVPSIIAAILGKLNTVTREKVVQDILSEFAESGDITAEPHMVAMVDIFLAGLRQQKQTTVRGAVKANPASKGCQITVEDAA